MIEKKVIDVVCGVIKINNQYLIAQRKDCDHEYIWEFPGGKVETNETKEEAIIRELKEELNIDCQINTYLGKVIDQRSDKDIHVYAYLCEKNNGEITLNDHYQYQLVNHDELKNYQFEPCDHQIFDYIKKYDLAYKKLNEVKVFRDPIHHYIHIEDQVIWDLINSREFQRLRRISQLGGVSILYHGATHNRFAHCLGVYEIVLRMCNEIKSLKESINEYEKILLLCSALLHDIGHGPLSHNFELCLNHHHEQFSIRIIEENSEIHRILFRYDPKLIKDIVLILNKKHPRKGFNQLISSQLDADRMDYLLRDAYYCATSYGNFDLERLLRTIRFVDDQLVIKESGIHCVEDYIMARYHMYWQVYLHPVVRSYEIMIQSLFHLLKKTYQESKATLNDYPMFIPFLNNEVTIDDFINFDENSCFYGFTLLANSNHFDLSCLSSMILNRQLFKYEDFKSKQQIIDHKKQLQALGYLSDYYVVLDQIKKDPYLPYFSYKKEKIMILKNDGNIYELSEVSSIVEALSKMNIMEHSKIYYKAI